MNNPLIISGEASETDSDDDSAPQLQLDMTNSIQGAVVLGEDSESDTDNASVASAVSALQLLDSDTSNIESDSLFQQKLRDLNRSLHGNIDSLIQNTADEAGKNLSTLEHQLLRSQITLQGAVSSLKSLSVNSLTLKNKLHSMLSSRFLPNISCSQVSNKRGE